jgi:hypothetical protein
VNGGSGLIRFGGGFGGRGLQVRFEADSTTPQSSSGGAVVPLPGREHGALDPNPVYGFEIRILSGRTNAKYSWERVHPNPDAPNGYNGSADTVSGGTHDGFFAYEVNGRTNLQAGAIAFARFSPVGPWLNFDGSGITSRSGPSAGGRLNSSTTRNHIFGLNDGCHIGDIVTTIGADGSITQTVIDRGIYS